ncbi:MAG TPA: DMT family transporter [Gaiellaceae bacterium]|nr:DMT family transporter [Gaiellaceae bacterium]
MDIVLALVAAFLFALGLVLQERAAATLPAEAVGKGFLVRLAHQPVWLLGLGAQGLGFVAQAIALGIGRMVIVQPLLVASIVFALPLGRLLEGRRIRREEWIGAALVTAGLGALLVVSKPEQGSDDASLLAWAVVGGATVGLAALLFALARGRAPALRAGLLGTAGGILFGLSAAVTKTTVSLLDEGLGAVFGDWHVYALVVISVVAFWLEQAALQTGALAAAVATTMAFDPLSSLVFGIALFDEALHESSIGYVLSALALATALAGLVILARAKGEETSPPASPEPVPAPA